MDKGEDFVLKQRLSPTALLSKVIELVEGSTSHRCYDFVPENAESPFYFFEVVSVTPKNTKSAFVDSYNLYIHCIAEPNRSSVGVFDLINDIQECLTDNLYLGEPYNILATYDNGVTIIKTDETGEKHAVCSFTIDVAYGLICK